MGWPDLAGVFGGEAIYFQGSNEERNCGDYRSIEEKHWQEHLNLFMEIKGEVQKYKTEKGVPSRGHMCPLGAHLLFLCLPEKL